MYKKYIKVKHFESNEDTDLVPKYCYNKTKVKENYRLKATAEPNTLNDTNSVNRENNIRLANRKYCCDTTIGCHTTLL